MPEKHPQITVIGGGTGTSELLDAFDQDACTLNAVVNMVDEGGSTGRLRNELGVLPPGDLRKCLAAMSTGHQTRKELFNTRYTDGPHKGHAWGNIYLSYKEKQTGSLEAAIDSATDYLGVKGRVIPSTLDNVRLALNEGDKKIVGESNVGRVHLPRMAMPDVELVPEAHLNPAAKTALAESDLIVIAPGNLYQSLAPALLVEGMGKVLAESPAPIAYVSNLVNNPQHTAEFAVHDYASEIERFAGAKILDYVLYNTDRPSQKLLREHALEGENPPEVDQSALLRATYQPIGGNFLSREFGQQNEADAIPRSFIRHDGVSVATVLMRIAKQEL